MASAVIQPVSPDWLLFFERFPVFLPDPFPVPASLFRDVSSGKVRRDAHSIPGINLGRI